MAAAEREAPGAGLGEAGRAARNITGIDGVARLRQAQAATSGQAQVAGAGQPRGADGDVACAGVGGGHIGIERDRRAVEVDGASNAQGRRNGQRLVAGAVGA